MCISWYKKSKMAEIKSKPKKWIKQVIIFLPIDYIISCNITDGCMLTSSLDIKKYFLIFLNSFDMTSAAELSLMCGC